MFETLRLSDLDKQRCQTLRETSNTRPGLWIVEENSVRAVVKDFSTKGFLFRNTAGRFLVWREEKAYRKLQSIRSIPRLYRNIQGLALVMEEVQGRDGEAFHGFEQLPEDFFHELRKVVSDIHRCGLAHCDLKTASNILVDREGKPALIDWGASISEREFRFFPLNLIYRRFVKDDLMAIIKLQLRLDPDSVSPEEKRLYYQRSRLETLARALRDKLRVLLKRVA